jgi:hypothetical protein
VKALLDLGQPYVSANALIGSSSNKKPPLIYLAIQYGSSLYESPGVHEKIFLLLERGADTASCSKFGESCLQLVLSLKITKTVFSAYQEDEFKDILMCIVTAGGDVYAANKRGTTVSKTACQRGHEELWREVLAECGYNPDEVFSLEDDFGHSYFREHHGMGVFAAATPNVRSTKLSFKEYGQQRKSLDCVRNVY